MTNHMNNNIEALLSGVLKKENMRSNLSDLRKCAKDPLNRECILDFFTGNIQLLIE